MKAESSDEDGRNDQQLGVGSLNIDKCGNRDVMWS